MVDVGADPPLSPAMAAALAFQRAASPLHGRYVQRRSGGEPGVLHAGGDRRRVMDATIVALLHRGLLVRRPADAAGPSVLILKEDS